MVTLLKRKLTMFTVYNGIEVINVDSSSVLYWLQTLAVLKDSQFKDLDKTFSFKTRLTIRNLYDEDKVNKTLTTGPREYQREKVASLSWKQALVETVLSDKIAKIPELHQRVIHPKDDSFLYLLEMLDGQQRSTTLIDFRDDEFPLPKMDAVDGHDVSNKYYSQLPVSVKEQFDNYTLWSTMYVNIDNDESRHLFINVLNNVNDMNAQEKRNAEKGVLAEYIRNIARFEKHELFEHAPHPKKKGEVKMKYFNDKFGIGRMQSDEWFAQLFYLTQKGWTSGVSQDALTKWYRSTNAEGGVYQTKDSPQWSKDRKMVDNLLNQCVQVLGNVPTANKPQVSNMVGLVMCLYYDELKNTYGKVDPKKYAEKFFSVYTEWSDTKKELYAGLLQHDGKKALGQFKSLFGGKGSNAMKSIRMVLEKNLTDLNEWGIVETDPRRNFTQDEIYRKWVEQGCKDYYTGEEIALEDCVGDHNIPHSWGVQRGGVTEYSNLIVTCAYHNGQKSDKFTAEEYLDSLKTPIAA